MTKSEQIKHMSAVIADLQNRLALAEKCSAIVARERDGLFDELAQLGDKAALHDKAITFALSVFRKGHRELFAERYADFLKAAKQ